jgi:hypothetical protein
VNITIEQLRFAVRQCTPDAPDSYADQLWQALSQVCECDAGNNVPHEQHPDPRPVFAWGLGGGSVIR